MVASAAAVPAECSVPKPRPLAVIPLGDSAAYVEFSSTLDLDVNSVVQRLAPRDSQAPGAVDPRRGAGARRACAAFRPRPRRVPGASRWRNRSRWCIDSHEAGARGGQGQSGQRGGGAGLLRAGVRARPAGSGEEGGAHAGRSGAAPRRRRVPRADDGLRARPRLHGRARRRSSRCRAAPRRAPSCRRARWRSPTSRRWSIRTRSRAAGTSSAARRWSLFDASRAAPEPAVAGRPRAFPRHHPRASSSRWRRAQ